MECEQIKDSAEGETFVTKRGKARIKRNREHQAAYGKVNIFFHEPLLLRARIKGENLELMMLAFYPVSAVGKNGGLGWAGHGGIFGVFSASLRLCAMIAFIHSRGDAEARSRNFGNGVSWFHFIRFHGGGRKGEGEKGSKQILLNNHSHPFSD